MRDKYMIAYISVNIDRMSCIHIGCCLTNACTAESVSVEKCKPLLLLPDNVAVMELLSPLLEKSEEAIESVYPHKSLHILGLL